MTRKKFLLTGGTGFLGSFLAAALLKRGNEVVFLGRAKNGRTLGSRMLEALDSADPGLGCQNVAAITVDFKKNNLGINNEKLEEMRGRVDGIWHLAASMSFKDRDRAETFSMNVGGLKNVLNLAVCLGCPIFYMSTIYVHGKAPGRTIFEEEFTKPRGFNNPYEESKFEAEKLVREWGKKNRDRFIIFRSSILIEKNQRALSFFGYYSIVYALCKLKKSLGEKKRTLIFPYSLGSSLNLMPVETAVDWMLEIADKKDALGQTFHIVNPHPFPIEDLAVQTFGAFGIKIILIKLPRWMVRMCFGAFCFFGSWVPGIKKLARRFRYYKYYIVENNIYNMANVKKFLCRDIEKIQLLPGDSMKTIACDFAGKIEGRLITK